MKLGMPLETGDIAFPTHAYSFNDAVGIGNRFHFRIPSEPLDCLVMDAVDEMGIILSVQFCEPGVILDLNAVPMTIL